MLAKLYKFMRKPSRFLAVLIPITFVWMLYLVKIQLDLQRVHVDKDYLREKIIELSKEYVKAVAKERNTQANAIDGQSIVEVPDLKQTTSVLLQNMLDRLMVLEKQLENVVAQSALDISELSKKVKSLNKSLISFAGNFTRETVVHQCKVPNDPSFPECANKVTWMSQHWKSDAKYSQSGVNGSLCSILIYLSEVESFCPMLENRKSKIDPNDCKIPPRDASFPNCKAKVEWMISSWKTDPCYAQDYGVNGTICSFLIYLSEAETWCQRLPGRQTLQTELPDVHQKVNLRDTSMEKLIDKLTKVVAEDRLKWIRTRVVRMYSYWTKAMKAFESRVNVTHQPRKKILIHIGVLAEEKTLHFAQTAGNGGPLGELVQWCDLITTLYTLGHDIRVTVEHSEMLSTLAGNADMMKRSCPPKDRQRVADLIFTDYYGLNHLKKKSRPLLQYYKCRLRIVDSFGTEAQFNYNGPLPAIGSPGPIRNNMLGKNGLNLKQYMTMFPHSPDNTFLGFVVDSKDNVPKSVKKKQQALTYGKHYYMWKDMLNREFLDIIHENFEVHATTGGLPLEQVEKYLPSYVVNHGVVGPGKLQKLLQESKIFVGLGFPYEGPAPLEAIAQGCFFLNPKFTPAKNRENTPFFGGKPTFRALTSQHPYVEEFIGEPHVLTVNVNDPAAVKGAIKKIMDNEPSPYLPFEFTHEGMLERVNALIHNQDLCNPRKLWPPLSSMTVITGQAGQSCKDVCLQKNLVCEPAYFEAINKADYFKKASFSCDSAALQVQRSSLVAPAFVGAENVCVLQAIPALYSCTAYSTSVTRICPCRDYRKGQVALCKTCY